MRNVIVRVSATESVTDLEKSLFERTGKIPPRPIEVRPTALAQPTTLTLTYDLDLQSPMSYGHDLLTCKSSRSTISRFRR